MIDEHEDWRRIGMSSISEGWCRVHKSVPGCISWDSELGKIR